MSAVFLDTHVVFWLAAGDDSLSRAALRLINASGQRSISSLSLVELRIKAISGRLRYPERFAELCEVNGISIEPFDDAAAEQFGRFATLSGGDPFDWMLLAQAAAIPGRTFLTADRRLLALGFDWVVDAAG